MQPKSHLTLCFYLFVDTFFSVNNSVKKEVCKVNRVTRFWFFLVLRTLKIKP